MREGWQLHIPPSPGLPTITDGNGHTIVTIHAPRSQAAVDGALFLNAPALLNAAQQCLEAFEVIAEHDNGPSGKIATQLRDYLATLLNGPAGLWTDGERGG